MVFDNRSLGQILNSLRPLADLSCLLLGCSRHPNYLWVSSDVLSDFIVHRFCSGDGSGLVTSDSIWHPHHMLLYHAFHCPADPPTTPCRRELRKEVRNTLLRVKSEYGDWWLQVWQWLAQVQEDGPISYHPLRILNFCFICLCYIA